MAQLNFNIPDELLARLDAQKPNYLDRKSFLCVLLDHHLTERATLVKRRGDTPERVDPMSEASSSKAVPLKEKKIKEKRFIFSVPEDLSDFKADLLEYWREHKSGKKSEAAAKILISGCRKIKENYGDKALAEQLELAKGYGWENITLKNYERFGLQVKKGYTAAQASEPNREHGTGRVFTADDFYGTTTPDNPLQGLF